MELIEIVTAYIAADEMSGQTLPYGLALALVAVKRLTRDETTFFLQKEQELVKRYAALDENGNVKMTANGTFQFRDPALAHEYERARLELGNADTPLEPVPLRVKAPPEIKAAFIEALEGFIEFYEDGDTP